MVLVVFPAFGPNRTTQWPGLGGPWVLLPVTMAEVRAIVSVVSMVVESPDTCTCRPSTGRKSGAEVIVGVGVNVRIV